MANNHLDFGVDLLPVTTDTYDLGTSEKKWNNIYSVNFNGNLIGNATSATNDSDGNAINSTYLKKSGGQMTGPLTWKNGDALPETTSGQYFLVIDAFASGGTTKWISKANALTSLGALASTTKYAASDAVGGAANTVKLTAHTSTTNGKYYYMPFSTTTSGGVSLKAHNAIYLYETVSGSNITGYDFCFGASTIKGSITLWDGGNKWGNIKTATLSTTRSYVLPDESGTIALTSDSMTPKSHTHGNISNAGTISTSATIATNDALVISTTANSGEITKTSITFDTTVTDKWLNRKGEWTTPPDTKVNVKLATTSKAYLLGTTTTPTSTTAALEAVADTGVYLDTTAGQLTASKFYAVHANGGQQEYRLTYGSTIDMSMMVDTSNDNHGLYDSKLSRWIVKANIAGAITVNGEGLVLTGTTATEYKAVFSGTADASANNAASVVVSGGLAVTKKINVGTLDGGQHIINGNVQINSQAGSYNEGIRINRSKTGYANIYLGGSRNSTSANQTGGWWIGTLSTPANETATGSTITNTVFTISQDSTNDEFAIKGTRGATRITNSGWAIRPRLTVGTTYNTSYTFYVNGTSYLNGAVTATGAVNLNSTLSVSGAITGLKFNGLTITDATTNFSIANNSVTATFQEQSGTVAYLSDINDSKIEIIKFFEQTT